MQKELVTTSQGTLLVESYYAKITSIWQQLLEYRPVDECKCEGMKKMLEFLNVEFVMIFLMGSNESFSQIRAQVLLNDPFPMINNVFSLIIQEERQRTIGASPLIKTITLMANTENKR